jgi:hypothetical protein
MATLIKQQSTVKPTIMTTAGHEDQNNRSKYIYTFASINLNVKQLDDNTYVYDSLVLPDFALNNIHNADDNTKYGVLVAHIIKAYYDDNAAMAIIGNYLLNSSDEKYKTEFDEYQKIRKLAKETAKHIIQNNIF